MRLLIVAFLVGQVDSWSYLAVISVHAFYRTHSTQCLAAADICYWAGPLSPATAV